MKAIQYKPLSSCNVCISAFWTSTSLHCRAEASSWVDITCVHILLHTVPYIWTHHWVKGFIWVVVLRAWTECLSAIIGISRTSFDWDRWPSLKCLGTYVDLSLFYCVEMINKSFVFRNAVMHFSVLNCFSFMFISTVLKCVWSSAIWKVETFPDWWSDSGTTAWGLVGTCSLLCFTEKSKVSRSHSHYVPSSCGADCEMWSGPFFCIFLFMALID